MRNIFSKLWLVQMITSPKKHQTVAGYNKNISLDFVHNADETEWFSFFFQQKFIGRDLYEENVTADFSVDI